MSVNTCFAQIHVGFGLIILGIMAVVRSRFLLFGSNFDGYLLPIFGLSFQQFLGLPLHVLKKPILPPAVEEED
jgi:hypothetical protein